ncbi:MAG: hypothetical protein ACOYOK_05740 [Pseudobdellovibrionaceae bacterium]
MQQRYLIVLFWFIGFLQSFAALAVLPQTINNLIYFENQANPAFQGQTRSTNKINIKHYEIPLSEAKSLISAETPPALLQSMVFEKKGQKYIRWIIHPDEEDGSKTNWLKRQKNPPTAYSQIELWLKSKNLDSKKYSYFEGYKTASRSLILHDPKSQALFSAKVSTRYLHGQYLEHSNKQQTWADAQREFATYNYIKKRLSKFQSKYLKVLDEPLHFGLSATDQAISLRNLDESATGTKNYIPAFSIFDEKLGPRLAELNGYQNPSDFALLYFEHLGKAVAELAFYTGLTSDSMHLQNFLWETDLNYKLTGRVVFRDVGDSYLWKPYFEKLKETDLMRIGHDQLQENLKLFHYNIFNFNMKWPSWLNMDQMFSNSNGSGHWIDRWLDSFEKTFSTLSGIPLENIKTPDIRHNDNLQYYFKNIENETVEIIFDRMQNNNQVLFCSQIF